MDGWIRGQMHTGVLRYQPTPGIGHRGSVGVFVVGRYPGSGGEWGVGSGEWGETDQTHVEGRMLDFSGTQSL